MLKTTINLEPKPKERARIVQGRAFTPKATRDYEEQVGWLLKSAMELPLIERDDVRVTLAFRTGTRQRKDIDNLCKAVLDAANGVVWKDDQQVVELHATLARGSTAPGTDVLIEVMASRTLTCPTCSGPMALERTFCSKDCYDSGQRKGIFRVCSGCGTQVYRQAGKSEAKMVFCTPECRAENSAKCRECAVGFTGGKQGTQTNFCSPECSDIWHRRKPLRAATQGTCPDCSAPTSRTAGRCRACYNKAMREGRAGRWVH